MRVCSCRFQEGAEGQSCGTASWSKLEIKGEGRGRGTAGDFSGEAELREKVVLMVEPQGSRSWLQEPERHLQHRTRRRLVKEQGETIRN